MRKSTFASLLCAVSILSSCNIISPVAGKTFYLLNIKDLVVQETQLDFKSDNTVDAHFTLNAVGEDCYNYKNTPSLSEQSVIMHYSVNGDVLTIDELNISIRTSQIDNEDIFYKTSIVEHLNDSIGYKRILAHSFSASLVDIYMKMINSSPPLPFKETTVVNEMGDTQRLIDINSAKHKDEDNPYITNPLGGKSK